MSQIELTRFRIKKGKEEKAQEWMDFLNTNHADTVATMAAERMHVETVFKEENPDGYTYFYWYSIQSAGGTAVENSENDIDKKHNQYWQECIDETYCPVNMKVEQILIAPAIAKLIIDSEK